MKMFCFFNNIVSFRQNEAGFVAVVVVAFVLLLRLLFIGNNFTHLFTKKVSFFKDTNKYFVTFPPSATHLALNFPFSFA